MPDKKPFPFPNNINPAAAIILNEIKISIVASTDTGALRIECSRPEMDFVAVLDLLNTAAQHICRKYLQEKMANGGSIFSAPVNKGGGGTPGGSSGGSDGQNGGAA